MFDVLNKSNLGQSLLSGNYNQDTLYLLQSIKDSAELLSQQENPYIDNVYLNFYNVINNTRYGTIDEIPQGEDNIL